MPGAVLKCAIHYFIDSTFFEGSNIYLCFTDEEIEA